MSVRAWLMGGYFRLSRSCPVSAAAKSVYGRAGHGIELGADVAVSKEGLSTMTINPIMIQSATLNHSTVSHTNLR